MARLMLPSQYLRQLCLLHGFDDAHLSVVSHATKLPEIEKSRKEEEPTGLIYIGSLLPNKGASHFIAMLEKLKHRDWEAHIVGDGPLRNALQTIVDSSGLTSRIHFHGRLATSERDALLARMRMLVFPTLLPESFGLVGIEAFAQGIPVVSYEIAGVTEWLRDGVNGLAVPFGDIEKLVIAVERLLDDSDLAHILGQRGRKMVETSFNEELCIARIEAVYQEVSEIAV